MSTIKNVYKYLIWCANEHVQFRVPELKAIAQSQNIVINWIESPTNDPFIIIGLKDDQIARELTSRSVLVKSCIRLLSTGHSLTDLHNNIKKYSMDDIAPLIDEESSYRLCVDSFNKKLTLCEKLEKIESFSYLPCKGKVDLKNAASILRIIEYYGLPDGANVPSLQRIFFGIEVCPGGRSVIETYNLRKRSFLSNTSMDPQLAFIMANMAQIRPGDLVVDPFVGSGSILVSAAQRGAYVWGWDIDYLTLHGLSKSTRVGQKKRQAGESVLKNLIQYGLQKHYLDMMVMDNSNLMWRTSPIIDAIITDPPYGIRESSTKVRSEELNGELHPCHIPSKASCKTADTFSYLLTFAAEALKVGGKLVFWLPVCRGSYSDDHIPTHPCLEIYSNSEHILTTSNSRRLITMFKTKEPMDGDLAHTNGVCDAAEFRRRFMEWPINKLPKQDKQRQKASFHTDKRGQAYHPKPTLKANPDNYLGIN